MQVSFRDDPLVQQLAKKLGPPVLTTSEEIRFNCPFRDCGNGRPDTKYHLYLNPLKEKWFCQRCKKGGGTDYLFKRLGVTPPSKSLTLWDQVVQSFLYPTSTYTQVEPQREVLPLDYTEMIPGTQAHKYCLSRGINDAKIRQYSIGFGTARLDDYPKEERKLYAGKNRVIFPDFDRYGDVTYWVARTYGKHTAKYKNAQSPAHTKIFNIGRLHRLEEIIRVVICEGPISAIIAGYDAVATYGKDVTGSQINMLVDLQAQEYVVAFDGDAVGPAMSLSSRLQRRGCNVKFVKFSYDEDPASVGPIESRKRVLSAPSWNDMSAMEALV